jgi:hypothetical protein
VFERDEPLVVGERFQRSTIRYEVTAIKPFGLEESDEFDALVEVKSLSGPVQAEFVQ